MQQIKDEILIVTNQKQNLSSVSDFPALIQEGNFDYVDFGCSKGGSLAFAKKRFGGRRGLGIDIAQSKVDSTRAAGFDAIRYDIHDIPDEKLVRFVVLSHFLEHVPSPVDVKAFLRKACAISKDFVYIQQPYFDADGYLFERGLKLFWSDWRGHPNRMTSLELWLLLRDLQNEGFPISYSIHSYRSIINSDDPSIHPLTSPVDQHEYISGRHPKKGQPIMFENNVFSELIGLITLPGTSHADLLKRIRYDRTIVNNEGNVTIDAGFEDKDNNVVESKTTLDRVKRSFRIITTRIKQ